MLYSFFSAIHRFFILILLLLFKLHYTHKVDNFFSSFSSHENNLSISLSHGNKFLNGYFITI